jgi:peptidoglycan/LPS O-acetylase OafA/YrhL
MVRSIFLIKTDYASRVFGLDVMRALAIIFVVMGHGGAMLGKADIGFPWIKLIDGVEMFFVLSGFLIGGILIKTFGDNAFGPVSILGFWIRRWFRTLPAYYLVLFLNILAVYAGITTGDPEQFSWKFFFFLQNFSGPFYDFFWESWSLSVEEWFYLLFPVSLALAFPFLKTLGMSKKAVFLTVIGVFLLVPFMLRLFITPEMEVDKFWLGVKIHKVVVFRLDSIAFGLLAAFIKHWYPNAWRKAGYAGFIGGILISYAVLYWKWHPNAMSTKVFVLSLQGIGCALMIPLFDSIRKGPRIMVRFFTHISLISYSMYLINLGLVAEVISLNIPVSGKASAWMMYLIYWLIVLSLSTLLYKYYEKPIMDLRDKVKIAPVLLSGRRGKGSRKEAGSPGTDVPLQGDFPKSPAVTE